MYFYLEYNVFALSDSRKVVWGKYVAKQLEIVPPHIAKKFYAWVLAVKIVGIRAVRVSPGFHDEPLRGKRLGQRSIRLSREYRAIYEERADGEVELIEVIEVNKHEY